MCVTTTHYPSESKLNFFSCILYFPLSPPQLDGLIHHCRSFFFIRIKWVVLVLVLLRIIHINTLCSCHPVHFKTLYHIQPVSSRKQGRHAFPWYEPFKQSLIQLLLFIHYSKLPSTECCKTVGHPVLINNRLLRLVHMSLWWWIIICSIMPSCHRY